MADFGHDLANLDAVTIPAYRPDIPPPKRLGDLPPPCRSIPILLIVFGVRAALGILAQFAHHGLPGPSCDLALVTFDADGSRSWGPWRDSTIDAYSFRRTIQAHQTDGPVAVVPGVRPDIRHVMLYEVVVEEGRGPRGHPCMVRYDSGGEEA